VNRGNIAEHLDVHRPKLKRLEFILAGFQIRQDGLFGHNPPGEPDGLPVISEHLIEPVDIGSNQGIPMVLRVLLKSLDNARIFGRRLGRVGRNQSSAYASE